LRQLPTVLTSIEQLKGKTIKTIEVDEYDEGEFILYYTEDHSILVTVKNVRERFGMKEITTTYMKDIIEIYEFYEICLCDWNVITHEQKVELDKEVLDKQEIEARKINDELDKNEYAEYLRLTKKFGKGGG